MSKKLGHTQDDLLMSSLQDFYANPVNINKMLPILNKENKISLRLIDWFVTNYSEVHGVEYTVNGIHLYVHASYKAQLKAYSKKRFDPFCRRNRIKFYYTQTKCIQTTVGQLNFFKWAIVNDIITYIIDHMKDIEEDMKLALAIKKIPTGSLEIINMKQKRNAKQYKNHELSSQNRFIVNFD